MSKQPVIPSVIQSLLDVDDTGTVACFIRQLLADYRRSEELLTKADIYLSLLWHGHVPSDRKDTELRLAVEQTIGELRAATRRRNG